MGINLSDIVNWDSELTEKRVADFIKWLKQKGYQARRRYCEKPFTTAYRFDIAYALSDFGWSDIEVEAAWIAISRILQAYPGITAGFEISIEWYAPERFSSERYVLAWWPVDPERIMRKG
jgi:hypothetical protein